MKQNILWSVLIIGLLTYISIDASPNKLRTAKGVSLLEVKQDGIELAYFTEDLALVKDKQLSHFYRKLIKINADKTYVVQDFYTNGDLKYTDPFIITNKKDFTQSIFKMHSKEGHFISWYSNGNKHGEGDYINGKPQGLWLFWHWNGNKRMAEYMVNGQRSGVFKMWFASGQKWVEGQYKNGKEEGYWRLWYNNSQKSDEGLFHLGLKEGLWKYWYFNGHKRAQGAYLHGKKNGLWQTWDDKGRKLPDKHYDNGDPIGFIED